MNMAGDIKKYINFWITNQPWNPGINNSEILQFLPPALDVTVKHLTSPYIISPVIVVFQLLSCVWLFCNLMDCSTPGSSVHGTSQARIKVFGEERESCAVVSDSLQPHGLYSPWNSPSQNTGVHNLSLLQGIFPTQGSNPGLPHCWWILYQLSQKE